MDHDALLEAVRTQGRALAVAASAGPVDAAVPTCPGWTVHDLAAHVGGFCGFWAHVLCEGTGRPKPPVGDPPDGEPVVAWLGDALTALVSELEATPEATPVWTWFEPDRRAGFVARRSAHELAVHRYDAESARYGPSPLPTGLAADGIDEVLGPLVTARPRTGRGGTQDLLLRASDSGLQWAVRLRPERVEWSVTSDAASEAAAGEEEPAGYDLVVTATTSDLELLLYGRPTLAPVDLHGDAGVMDRWSEDFRF